MKAQGALEYLILIAAVLAIAAVVVLFITSTGGSSASSAALSACKEAAGSCSLLLMNGPNSCSQCDTACVGSSGKEILPDAVHMCKLGKQGSIVEQSGLVLLLHFDEGSGNTAIDSSGKDNNGVINGSTAYETGKVGTALRFNGTVNKNVEINNVAIPTATGTKFTVEFWMKGNTYNAAPIAFGGIALYGTDCFGFNTNGGQRKGIQDAATALGNSWHYVSAIFSNTYTSQSELYIDGVKYPLPASPTCGPDLAAAQASPRMTVGSGWYGTYPFNGLIDEVRVYSRALTAEEIQSHYRNF